MYINKKDNSKQLVFSMDQFLKVQSQIACRYDSPSELDIDYIGEKEFTNKLDKYLLHAVEEVTEALDETDKSDIGIELLEEIIDIAMYIGSTIYVLDSNLYLPHPDTSELNIMDDDIRIYLLDITRMLIRPRRSLPQRKWHKPVKMRTKADMTDTLVSINNDLYNALTLTMSLIVSISGLDNIDNVNNLIISKQNKVLGL